MVFLMAQIYIGVLFPGFVSLIKVKNEHYLLFSPFLSSWTFQKSPGHYTEGERKFRYMAGRRKAAFRPGPTSETHTAILGVAYA